MHIQGEILEKEKPVRAEIPPQPAYKPRSPGTHLNPLDYQWQDQKCQILNATFFLKKQSRWLMVIFFKVLQGLSVTREGDWSPAGHIFLHIYPNRPGCWCLPNAMSTDCSRGLWLSLSVMLSDLHVWKKAQIKKTQVFRKSLTYILKEKIKSNRVNVKF